MNKRGIALILSFMVIAVLAIMGVGLISRSISGSNIVQRYVNSTKAFWLAEAGVAEAIEDLPNSPGIGDLGNSNNTYDATTTLIGTGRYRISSTGSITLSSGSTITRTIQVIVQGFQFGTISSSIATTGDLTIGGSATVDEPTESGIELSFEDIFGMTEAELRALANNLYTDPPNNVQPVDGITWIEITPGNQLTIGSDTWVGSGILVVNGDLKISGGHFSGILWVAGNLDMITGSADIAGAIFVDSEDDTKITGDASIAFSSSAISDALGNISPEMLSWSEL